jgi:hypothetical protein
MQLPKYLYKSEEFMLYFEFVSDGPNGRIKRVVQYSETSTKNVFNLGFGDYDERTKRINDLSISNNGDSMKVLATVASTVYAFTEKYPDVWIIAAGSTSARTRLYRMGISNNLAEIAEDFLVYGYTQKGDWEEFTINKHYEAFLITRKSINFEL